MTEKTLDLPFITYNGRTIPKASTTLFWPDRLGSWKARWGIGRMKYIIEPGLFAVGNPDADSPVFVTANYKMSFDSLRSQLTATDGWILVLDTKGINVWCAAGKGTFGTDELTKRIHSANLTEIVNHRTLILPQLAAPGVAAHKVKQQTGFRVIYGPILAKDLPAFLHAGQKATHQMRQVKFPLRDRTALVPMEITMTAKYAILTAIFLIILAGINRKGYSISLTLTNGLPAAAVLLTAFLAAAVLGPILLPWLPGRAFSLKGIWIALIVTLGLYFYNFELFDTIAWLLIIPAITSFTLMNFTGASTYTSLSGVRREMRIAVPLQLLCAVLGSGLWITARFI